MAKVSKAGICSRCNEEFELADLYEYDGELLCQDCFDTETFCCNQCERRFWNDENHGDSDTPLCENCYNSYYTNCERCRVIINHNDAFYEEEEREHDTPYCESCYHYQSEKRNLHDYSYRPAPVFHGKGNRYFGVELEIDDGGKSSENAAILTRRANKTDEHIYIKTDGSLDDGMEIVTHPMTLEYHTVKMPWREVTEKAIDLEYQSHRTDTCGLHIHVNRNSFGDESYKQEECIGRILFIVERFWEELLCFSRRTEYQIEQWARRYGFKNTPSEILDHAKKGYAGRYTAVNITNWQTIEFRLFRGTLKLNTIIATLQLVNEICEVAFLLSDKAVRGLSWCSFIERIDGNRYPELIAYLKERRLYINEPIEVEEDA